MKYQTIISLILLPQLAPALGAAVTAVENDVADLEKRNVLTKKANVIKVAGNGVKAVGKGAQVAGNGIKVAGKGVGKGAQVAGKGIGKGAKVAGKEVGKGVKVAGNGIKVAGDNGIKATGQGVKVVGHGIQNLEGEVQKTFSQMEAVSDTYKEFFDGLGDTIPACVKQDCQNTYFMNEAMEWVKQAVEDVGVVIHEHPVATAALIMGVSFLLVELIGGGMILPAVLRAVGFGSRGPIKGSLAAAVQRLIHPVKFGSLFSRFQSIAMDGAAMPELKRLVNTIISGTIGTAIAALIGGGGKPHDHSFTYGEWRNWTMESSVSSPSGFTNALWGDFAYGGCVGYGYRDVRAPLVLPSIPEGTDPVDACARTMALIDGIGYKTPLDCVDEGSGKGVTGIWYVPTDQAQCLPKWGKFEDEGCILYGRRRKFSRVFGLNNRVDWMSMCQSMPATIDDKYDGQPSHCDDKGVFGIYGVFDFPDEQCECSCAHN